MKKSDLAAVYGSMILGAAIMLGSGFVIAHFIVKFW